MDIDRRTVKAVIAARRKGMPWLEIADKYGEGKRSFILQVRPLMKELDPTSVKPSYDRKAKKSAAKRASKLVRS